MKTINEKVKAVGSLVNMDQAVRLISNLGGTVIGLGNFEVCFIDNGEAKSIRFVKNNSGWIEMA